MKRLLLSVVLLGSGAVLYAQNDLLNELEQAQKPEIDYAFQTFKGTRLVNGHTVETKAKGTLEFIFAHRFGPISGGLYEMFGLDQAYTRLGLDYGITDRLSVSIGRYSSYPVDKTMDGYLKYKLLRQSSGARIFPVTVTAFGGIAYKLSPQEGVENIDRLAYVGQFHIARKFSPRLSLQLSPSFVHRNAVDQAVEKNNQIAIGMGGRIKLTRSVAITTEYYYRISPPDNDLLPEGQKLYNALGFGIDIETGGHVFQLVLTNTRGLTERAFITETTGNFFAGDISLGFNVTRTFQLKKKK